MSSAEVWASSPTRRRLTDGCTAKRARDGVAYASSNQGLGNTSQHVPCRGMFLVRSYSYGAITYVSMGNQRGPMDWDEIPGDLPAILMIGPVVGSSMTSPD